MNEAEYQRLFEAGLRRKLDRGEEMELEAFLATRPDLRARWEEEQGLNQLLQQLPNAPVSSNFTAQVLAALDRETRPEPVSAWLRWWQQACRLRWLQPAAAACLLAGVGLLSVQQYRRVHEAEQMANTIKQLTFVPDVATLKDFEAINRMSQATKFVDVDLLSLPE